VTEQVRERARERHEADSVALGERGEPEVFGERALADTGLSAQQCVLAAFEKAERVLRSTLGLHHRVRCARVLRALERKSQVVTTCSVCEVRRDDRAPLGRHRLILPP